MHEIDEGDDSRKVMKTIEQGRCVTNMLETSCNLSAHTLSKQLSTNQNAAFLIFQPIRLQLVTMLPYNIVDMHRSAECMGSGSIVFGVCSGIHR